VAEVFPVARIGDHLAGHPVDLLAGDARPYRLEGGLLRLAYDVVDAPDLAGHVRAHVHGARGVRAVPELEATEVQDHRVAGPDAPLARLVVGVGPVGTRAHHGEVDLAVAVPAKELGQVGGDLGLAPPGEPHAQDVAVGGIGRRSGGRQAGQLALVLD